MLAFSDCQTICFFLIFLPLEYLIVWGNLPDYPFLTEIVRSAPVVKFMQGII